MGPHPCCHSKCLSGQRIVFGFFRPDMNIEWGVAIYMYLKHSPEILFRLGGYGCGFVNGCGLVIWDT